MTAQQLLTDLDRLLHQMRPPMEDDAGYWYASCSCGWHSESELTREKAVVTFCAVEKEQQRGRERARMAQLRGAR